MILSLVSFKEKFICEVILHQQKNCLVIVKTSAITTSIWCGKMFYHLSNYSYFLGFSSEVFSVLDVDLLHHSWRWNDTALPHPCEGILPWWPHKIPVLRCIYISAITYVQFLNVTNWSSKSLGCPLFLVLYVALV